MQTAVINRMYSKRKGKKKTLTNHKNTRDTQYFATRHDCTEFYKVLVFPLSVAPKPWPMSAFRHSATWSQNWSWRWCLLRRASERCCGRTPADNCPHEGKSQYVRSQQNILRAGRIWKGRGVRLETQFGCFTWAIQPLLLVTLWLLIERLNLISVWQ